MLYPTCCHVNANLTIDNIIYDLTQAFPAPPVWTVAAKTSDLWTSVMPMHFLILGLFSPFVIFSSISMSDTRDWLSAAYNSAKSLILITTTTGTVQTHPSLRHWACQVNSCIWHVPRPPQILSRTHGEKSKTAESCVCLPTAALVVKWQYSSPHESSRVTPSRSRELGRRGRKEGG